MQLGMLFLLASIVSFVREVHCRKALELELAETRNELKRVTLAVDPPERKRFSSRV